MLFRPNSIHEVFSRLLLACKLLRVFDALILPNKTGGLSLGLLDSIIPLWFAILLIFLLVNPLPTTHLGLWVGAFRLGQFAKQINPN